jgi:valyl-tRNA synthetase
MEKQYDSRGKEQIMQQIWADQHTYAVDEMASRMYTIDTPPPTVSGSLHIGHIFSYTQTDICARFQRMDGHEIFYPFGFDDNGLPTERFIEKKCGVSAYKLGRSAFIELCLKETAPVELEFKRLWERMGLSVDWRFCYATIDKRTRRISQQSFLHLLKKGYVYRTDEPAPYCTTCRTTVAQAELDDVEQDSVFYTLQFSLSKSDEFVEIATTRPELLSSAVAVLYHPQDERYRHLAGCTAVIPLFGQEVPLIADELVIPEKGTGLVMCCTFGDTTDVIWYKKHRFAYRSSLGADGKWLPETGILAGLTARQAREKVVEALRAGGFCREQRPIKHMVNVHERCKQDIEYIVLPQWFLKILPYKKELIALADTITWYPEFMKARYVNWVENLTWDWCLSRQRFFGIPFPVWHCTLCRHIITPPEDTLPVDPQEQPWPGACTQCGGAVVPDTDVMDTWNTSSLTPYLCESLRDRKENVFDAPYEQMSMRPQAHDIIRTWAFYTIVKTWMHHGVAPWKDIVISGHVITASREKISKSKGNSVLAPEVLLERFPADAIRHWTASGLLGHDVSFSEQQLQIGNKLLVKLWNAFRFIDEHTRNVSCALMKEKPTQAVHRWLLHHLSAAYEQYRAALQRYEFSAALASLDRFFWQIFCDDYLELIKDQLFHPEHYAVMDVEETRAVLYGAGLRIIQLYAPFVPHVTECLYQELYAARYGVSSLHRTHYVDVQQVWYDEQAAESISLLLAAVSAVRRLKTDRQLSLRTDIAAVRVYGSASQCQLLAPHAKLLQGIARAAHVTCHEDEQQATRLEETADGLVAVVHLS